MTIHFGTDGWRAVISDTFTFTNLRMLSQAHRHVLDMLASALGPLTPGVQCCGTSDLALGALKFSGNSARCRRNYLLYHGTLLYDFPLELIDRCLAMPPRMPA